MSKLRIGPGMLAEKAMAISVIPCRPRREEVDKSAEIRYNPSHMRKAGKGTSSGSAYGKESFRAV